MMKATNLFLLFLSFFSISTSAQYVKFESVNLVCDAVVNGQVGLKIVATYTVTAQPGGEKRYPGNYGASGGIMECQQCSGTGQCKYCYGRGTR